jgi:hypothetical protein
MRKPFMVLFTPVLLVGLLLPRLAWARPQTVLASATITGEAGAALTTELVGVAVTHNPGFEKTIVQQLPPFTVPVFVDVEKNDATGQVMISRFDTTLVLTNTTDDDLVLEITVLDSTGTMVLASFNPTLAAHASLLIAVSSLLP